jgi:hypothetical protein
MGKLLKIKDTLNGVAPKWSNIKTNIRGLPFYIDPILTGNTRFARKTGSVGLINPDTEVGAAGEFKGSNLITVDRVNSWFKVGTYVTIGDLERFKILNIFNDTQYELNDSIKVSTANKGITLYSVPLISVGNFSKNQTTIQVRSKYSMMLGDKLSFLLQKNLFREVDIKTVKYLGESLSEYNLTYELELINGIPYALTTDQELQMRAFPAYVSSVIRIPNIVSSKPMGPFLIDYYGGKIQADKNPDVYMSIQPYNIFGNKIFTDDPFAVTSNYPFSTRSIQSDSLIFWDLIFGNFKLYGENVIAVCDDNGKFGVTQALYPNFKAGNKWKVSV